MTESEKTESHNKSQQDKCKFRNSLEVASLKKLNIKSCGILYLKI